ncbi:ABC transporter ATP-binding protein [Jatrophihabitans telluris]|uniref:ABC transporter ATP-binding protein n=1 Tax=Jatrophihabitans telluris TaxID=2038343 RepID=A0ABY4QZS9_9ACTN|nr:ABC transporter ATP-binding protein [Jatrophihabitans telluris]UQX88964.1 ABC transporter ATP-binding protein [Jatrophihabitans telluris]
MTTNSVLTVEGLSVGYGGAPVVRGVDFAVGSGQINCVVGPNGAGKSTALKAVAGVLRPIAGKIIFDGSDVTRLSTDARVARGLGYVPQVANVFATLTVMENLQIGAHAKRRGIKERTDSICELFPALRDALGRPAGTLSGGQRSMLALSRALMGDPKLLLLDEPTAGLAPKLEDQVWEHILTIQAHGIGVLIVEQNTRRALTHSHSAYVMVDGLVAADGTAAEMLDRPDLVDMYLGGA